MSSMNAMSSTKRGLAAFGSGLLFAAGLALAGMTRPSKVLGFLDVTGAWDPSLGFVMAGAVAVAALAFRLQGRLRSPVLGDRFDVPPARAAIDPKLVGGAAIFGVGWGLSGLCPGPAVVSLASGQLGAAVFVGAMLLGVLLERTLGRHAPKSIQASPDKDTKGIRDDGMARTALDRTI
jgi:uncharacterized membrane protein YedE/YeeE